MLNSHIFIDGGDPQETKQANELLKSKKPQWNVGIEGQTTNPTLVAKNPDIQKYLTSGKKLSQLEALDEYKKIVTAVAQVTSGPISIQVIADKNTSSEEMLAQARVYKDWIPNGVVKFPCTHAGLSAAEIFCEEFPVNITLNFSQSQAAAVYQATQNAKHRVFVSPFVGRLDDRGENGMNIVEHELHMYGTHGDGHVEVLTASVRTLDHLLFALHLKSPAITLPFKIFLEWAQKDFESPNEDYKYDPKNLKQIPYQELSLEQDWREYNISHELTDVGIEKFMADWMAMIK